MISGNPLGADFIAKKSGVCESLSSFESSKSMRMFFLSAAVRRRFAYLVYPDEQMM